MKKRGRRIRAAIGMGLTWGAAWGAVGGLLARVPGFDSDLPFPLLFAPLGFITGVIFSGILVAAASRGRVNRITSLRFAGWGAASGVLLSGIFAVGAAVRGASWPGELLLFGPPLAAAGAICAAGSLALARWADRRALRGSDLDGPELTTDEKRELLGFSDTGE